MNYRVLGSTGLQVGEVGMGGIGAMGKYGAISAQEFSRTMARAEELGMNFLDTAPSYGDSEAVFGYHLKDHRDRWIVCTKVGHCGSGERGVQPPTAEEIRQQLFGSLRRLCVEHVDIALIHSIDQYADGTTNLVERVSGPNGPLEGLDRLRQQGLVRFIGVSGQLPELLEAAASNLFQVLLTYNTYNLLVREARERLFPLAKSSTLGWCSAGPSTRVCSAGRRSWYWPTWADGSSGRIRGSHRRMR
jgi:aryl-alcohol dehydrogenase-like predicted oxidoreductase